MSDISAEQFVGIIDLYASLVRSGNYHIGYCPVCHSVPPKMVVRPALREWHCYRCGEGGGLGEFLVAAEHISPEEARARVAELAANAPQIEPVVMTEPAAEAAPAAAAAAVAEAEPAGVQEAPAAGDAEAPGIAAEAPAAAELPQPPAAETAPPPAASAPPAGGEQPANPVAARELEPLLDRLAGLKGFRGAAVLTSDAVVSRDLSLSAEGLGAAVALLDRSLAGGHQILAASADAGLASVTLRNAESRLLLIRGALRGSPYRVLLLLGADANEAMLQLSVRSFLSQLG